MPQGNGDSAKGKVNEPLESFLDDIKKSLAFETVEFIRTGWSLYQEREKLFFFVNSRIKTYAHDRLLGFLWWFIDPMLWILTYMLLVEYILRRGTNNYPLFLACAILPWRWFSSATTAAGGSLLAQAGLLKSISVDRLLMPVGEILVASVNFLLSLLVLVVLMFFFDCRITPYLLMVPVVGLLFGIYILAFGISLSIVQVYIRDALNVWTIILRIWFYLSPGIYPSDALPDRFRPLFMLNPIAVLFEAFRDCVMYGRAPDWSGLVYTGVLGVLFLLLALSFFMRHENNVMRML